MAQALCPEPVVGSSCPEDRGHLPLGTSDTRSPEPPPLPLGPQGAISAQNVPVEEEM